MRVFNATSLQISFNKISPLEAHLRWINQRKGQACVQSENV